MFCRLSRSFIYKKSIAVIAFNLWVKQCMTAIVYQLEIAKELDDYVLNCMMDENGRYVIKKCIECINPVHLSFVTNALREVCCHGRQTVPPLEHSPYTVWLGLHLGVRLVGFWLSQEGCGY